MPGVSYSPSSLRVLGPVAVAVSFSLAILAARPEATPDRAQTPRPGDRAMYVSALNGQGAPVTDLRPEEFVVREDGIRREVLTATKATDPVTLALLIDNSAAASPYIADIRTALKAFVTRMAGRNPIALTTFGERPSVLVDYSLTGAALERGIARVFSLPGSGAYFLEAVDDACKALKKRDFDRAVVLAISTGGPEFSERHYTELLTPLRESGANFTVMVFTGGRDFDLRNDGVRERADGLRW